MCRQSISFSTLVKWLNIFARCNRQHTADMITNGFNLKMDSTLILFNWLISLRSFLSSLVPQFIEIFSLEGAIKIHANPVSYEAAVFFCQCENKWACIFVKTLICSVKTNYKLLLGENEMEFRNSGLSNSNPNP